MKLMRRITAVLLSLAILLSLSVNSSARTDPLTVYGKRLQDFETQNPLYFGLVDETAHGYMNLGKDFWEDRLVLTALDFAEKITGETAMPDQEKYTEVLVTLMGLYDSDISGDIQKLAEYDSLKKPADYFVDAAKIGASAISVYTGLGGASSEIQKAIAKAIDGIMIVENTLENGVKAVTMLDTFIHSYSTHRDFLSVMEKSSIYELSAAAGELKNGLDQAAVVQLNAFKTIYVDSYNYDANNFFFCEPALDFLKTTAEYASDDSVKLLVDGADKAIGVLSVIKAGWELTTGIATLVGDIAVGGEDLLNRVSEIMALYNISITLDMWLDNCRAEYYASVTGDEDEEAEEAAVRRFVLAGEYLTLARLRGEYCTYSIVAEDAGLLSRINKENAENAKLWFDGISERMVLTRNTLIHILDPATASFGEVVSEGSTLFYWRYNEGSFDRSGLMGSHYAKKGAVNELVMRTDANDPLSETVIFTDCGSGVLCAAGGRIIYEADPEGSPTELRSVRQDGTDPVRYGEGYLLGCIDSENVVWNTKDASSGEWSISILNIASGESVSYSEHDASYLGVFDGVLFFSESIREQNKMSVYAINPSDNSIVTLCTLDMSFVESMAGPAVGEVHYLSVNEEKWLYFSYGSIAGSGVFYQGGKIARVKPDGTGFEILAGNDGSLAGADFTVNPEDGSIQEVSPSRVETTYYTGLTKYWKQEDDSIYAIREDTGENLSLFTAEDLSFLKTSEEGLLILKYAQNLNGKAYARLEYNERGEGDVGWRPAYDLKTGALLMKDFASGEVTVLYTY